MMSCVAQNFELADSQAEGNGKGITHESIGCDRYTEVENTDFWQIL